jgi:hypothetical protein
MMIGLLEVQAIRRLGELIKGIGSQLTDYADKKEKQLAEDSQRHQELLNRKTEPDRRDMTASRRP